MPNHLCLSALACVLGIAAWPILAVAQPAKTPAPTVGQPAAAVAPAATPDLCYAGNGLTPKQKIKTCTDVIDSGALKGLGLGFAYFNRGVARANDGDPKGSMTDYRMALRFYNDVIRTSAPSGQIVFQRGVIYHTMGDADQAIVDYSDAIRLTPNDVQPYVTRGIILHTKKDNNEGAISDFNAALKLNRCEATAWINRALVYKRKGNLNQSIADLTDAIKCLPGKGPTVSTVTVDASGKPFGAQYYKAMSQSTQLADAHYQQFA